MVRIILDSTTDLPAELAQEFAVVPLTIRFGQEEYTQGVNLSNTQFYEKLIECDDLPTTSQASPFQFEAYFQDAVNAGDEVVCITISSALSGTFQSAQIAAEEYPGKVFVVDGKSVSVGSGILAQYALELKNRGLCAREIAAALEAKREDIRIIALLDTLEYLKKGGRISAAVALAGGLLGIKPVVCMEDGAVKLLGKARGSKQGNNLLVKEIQSAGGVDFDMPLLLGYTGLNDALLHKYKEDSAALWQDARTELPQALIGSVVGTHVGPGAVAVAFFSAK